MTLDDISKLFGAGGERGSVPRHRANDTIFPQFAFPPRTFSAPPAHGHCRAFYGPAQVISIGSRSRICQGSRDQRRVKLDLISGVFEKTNDSFFHRSPKLTVPQETEP